MKTNSLLFGPIGTGKSYITRTLLPEYPDRSGKIHKGAGLGVRYYANEPGWEATNGDLTCDMDFHVHELLPANPPLDVLIDWYDRIQNLTIEELYRKGIPSQIRKGFNQYMGLYTGLKHFVCDRCGEDFGSAEDWGEEIALVNDGLTGISEMAIHYAVGPKSAAMTLPEFGAAQKHVLAYVKKCVAFECSYVLIAHWAREPDPVEGGTNITIHTVGKALAPILLLNTFDEVILTERKGNIYTWNMADDRVDQKARRLEYKAGLRPDFTQIFSKG